MESVRQTQKKYCSRAMLAAIGASLVFMLAGHKGLGKGLILGAVFSVINFVLIGETLPMRIGKAKKKTFLLALGSIFFRYILLAAPIIIALKLDQFSLVTVICGIFMVQIAILADHLTGYIFSATNKRFQGKM